MHYQVSRNGQMYGPYTLDDLQRYLASGNVLPTDLAKSDEMPEWVPVSTLLAAPAPLASPTETGFSTPGYADVPYAQAAVAPAAANRYEGAPNLHWGLVLLFGFLTCTLFMPIWNSVISAWLRKVQPNANALFLYLAMIAMIVGDVIVGAVLSAQAVAHGLANDPIAMAKSGLSIRLGIFAAIWVVKLMARYSEKASLEQHYNGPEPIGLQLNPVLIFFFGGVYIQYHLNRINAMKQAALYGAGRAF